MTKILMIIAPRNFRDEELLHPKEEFESVGFEVKIASKAKTAKGMLGTEVNADLDLSEVNVQNFDAIIFVGGSGTTVYFNDIDAQRIAKEALDRNKLLCAICIAPSILANAGLLKGKKVTAFPSEEQNLRTKGAIYTGKEVEQDGKIITAKDPKAARAFGRKIVENL